ncbi:hypothetical protein GW17_00006729, partial [Ensete ventricosum]
HCRLLIESTPGVSTILFSFSLKFCRKANKDKKEAEREIAHQPPTAYPSVPSINFGGGGGRAAARENRRGIVRSHLRIRLRLWLWVAMAAIAKEL